MSDSRSQEQIKAKLALLESQLQERAKAKLALLKSYYTICQENFNELQEKLAKEQQKLADANDIETARAANQEMMRIRFDANELQTAHAVDFAIEACKLITANKLTTLLEKYATKVVDKFRKDASGIPEELIKDFWIEAETLTAADPITKTLEVFKAKKQSIHDEFLRKEQRQQEAFKAAENSGDCSRVSKENTRFGPIYSSYLNKLENLRDALVERVTFYLTI